MVYMSTQCINQPHIFYQKVRNFADPVYKSTLPCWNHLQGRRQALQLGCHFILVPYKCGSVVAVTAGDHELQPGGQQRSSVWGLRVTPAWQAPLTAATLRLGTAGSGWRLHPAGQDLPTGQPLGRGEVSLGQI